MNRRSFFSGLFGASAAAGTCAVAQSAAPSKYKDVAAANEAMTKTGAGIMAAVKVGLNPLAPPDPTIPCYPCGRYRHLDGTGQQWSLFWATWHQRVDHSSYVAQWLAYPTHADGTMDTRRRPVYSSSPGVVSYFISGQCFMDLSLQEGQRLIDHTSTKRDMDAQNNLAFDRLLDFLKNHPQIGSGEADILASL